MRVHLWRWDVNEWSFRGETSSVSTRREPIDTAMMHVPHSPLWYGNQPAPPSSSSASDKPPPRYNVPRR